MTTTRTIAFARGVAGAGSVTASLTCSVTALPLANSTWSCPSSDSGGAVTNVATARAESEVASDCWPATGAGRQERDATGAGDGRWRGDGGGGTGAALEREPVPRRRPAGAARRAARDPGLPGLRLLLGLQDLLEQHAPLDLADEIRDEPLLPCFSCTRCWVTEFSSWGRTPTIWPANAPSSASSIPNTIGRASPGRW